MTLTLYSAEPGRLLSSRTIPRAKYTAMLTQMAQEAGVPEAAMSDRCTVRRVVWARKRLWEALRMEGYSLMEISRAAGLNSHSNVLRCLNSDETECPPLTESAVKVLRRRYRFDARPEVASTPHRARPLGNKAFLSALAREARG